jgi:hypothetical protein
VEELLDPARREARGPALGGVATEALGERVVPVIAGDAEEGLAAAEEIARERGQGLAGWIAGDLELVEIEGQAARGLGAALREDARRVGDAARAAGERVGVDRAQAAIGLGEEAAAQLVRREEDAAEIGLIDGHARALPGDGEAQPIGPEDALQGERGDPAAQRRAQRIGDDDRRRHDLGREAQRLGGALDRGRRREVEEGGARADLAVGVERVPARVGIAAAELLARAAEAQDGAAQIAIDQVEREAFDRGRLIAHVGGALIRGSKAGGRACSRARPRRARAP